MSWFALLTIASAFGSSTWEEWSDTDVSRFWNLQEMTAARSRAGATPDGDVQFAIPISLPPSRFTPSLAVSYGANRGDDLTFGAGWQLSLPAIYENPTANRPDSERFVSPDGPLVHVSGSAPNGVYRPEIDTGGGRKYTRSGTTWTDTGYDGVVQTYVTQVSSTDLPGRAVLTEAEDAFGNEVKYTYDTQGRVLTMVYGGNADSETAENLVTFTYADRDCDRTDYRFDPPSVHDKRLSVIEVKDTSVLYVKYNFTYGAQCPDQVISVRETKYNPVASTNRYQTWTFDYSDPTWTTSTWTGPDVLGRSSSALSDEGYEEGLIGMGSSIWIGNRDGDPLPDVMDLMDAPANGTIMTIWADGTDIYEARTDAWVNVDFNSDGYTDHLEWSDDETIDIYLKGPGPDEVIRTVAPGRALVGLGTTIQLPLLPGFGTLRVSDLVDMNGDGFLDLVEAKDGELDIYFWNEGDEDWSDLETREAPWCDPGLSWAEGLCYMQSAQQLPAVSPVGQEGWQTSGFVDLNGDSLPDFVEGVAAWINHGSTWVLTSWANLPTHLSEHRETYTSLSGLFGATEITVRTTQGLADLDGDGLVDLVVGGMWRRNTGSAFAGTQTLGGDFARAFEYRVNLNPDGENEDDEEEPECATPDDILEDLKDRCAIAQPDYEGHPETSKCVCNNMEPFQIGVHPPYAFVDRHAEYYNYMEYSTYSEGYSPPECVYSPPDCLSGGTPEGVDEGTNMSPVWAAAMLQCGGDPECECEFVALHTCSMSDPYRRTTSETETLIDAAPADWNGDGTTDLLDAEAGELHHMDVRAGLLMSVTLQGGTVANGPTTFTWVPTGDLEEPGMHLAFPTLDTVSDLDVVVDDGVHGGTVTVTTHEFANGDWDPIRRRFMGFANHEVVDPAGATHRYEVETAVPLTGRVAHEAHFTPEDLSKTTPKPSMEVTRTWLSPESGGVFLVQAATESQIERGIFIGGTRTERDRTVTYDYDVDDNLAEMLIQSEDTDDVRINLDWASSLTSDRRAPSEIRVYGTDADDSPLALLQERRFEYDDLSPGQIDEGALTAVESDRFGDGLVADVRRYELTTNDYGQPVTVRSPGGIETDFDYDATYEYVETTTNALSHTTQQTRNVWGNVTETIGATGIVYRTSYDMWGRPLISQRESASHDVQVLSSHIYTDGAYPRVNLRTFADEVGVSWETNEYQYLNSWGDTLQSRTYVGPSGFLVADVAYDHRGQAVKVGKRFTSASPSYAAFSASTFGETAFDELGRFLNADDFLNHTVTQKSSDPWLTDMEDANGVRTHAIHDGLGRAVERWSSADSETEVLESAVYTYDGLGRLVSMIDPDGVETTYFWSSLGELLRIESPDFGSREYMYDDDGRLIGQLDSDGRTVTWTLDDLGRVTARSEDTVNVETFHWDGPGAGLLGSVEDAAGEVTYTYDEFDRVASETREFPDLVEATVMTTYDPLDRVVSQILPDGAEINYSYLFGRLLGVDATMSDTSFHDLASMSYSTAGEYTGFTSDWGLDLDLTRDTMGRVTDIDWALDATTDRSQHVGFEYEDNGRIASRTLGANETEYAYDAAGRVIEATGSQPGTWTLSDGGSPITIAGPGAGTFAVTSGTHRATGGSGGGDTWENVYDAAGRVTRTTMIVSSSWGPSKLFTYDALGRPLTAVAASGNPAVPNAANGTITRYYGHDGSIPYELIDGVAIHRLGPWEKAGSEESSWVSAGGFPVVQIIDGDDLRAVMADAQGTPLLVADEAGVIKSTLQMDIYGHEIASSGTRDLAHQWLGVARSEKMGLMSTAGRLYEERSTAFLQPEPMLLGLSAAKFAEDPYAMNPYMYGRWDGASRSDAAGDNPLVMPAFLSALDAHARRQYAAAPTNSWGHVGWGIVASSFEFAHEEPIVFGIATAPLVGAAEAGLVRGFEGSVASREISAVVGRAESETVEEIAAAESPIIVRGLSGKGGIFEASDNAAGGRVVTAVGEVSHSDVATQVSSGLYAGGDVRILSGAHGLADGTMIPEASFLAEDIQAFGGIPGVTVHDVTTMSAAEITRALQSPGTTIGAFCNSAACLAPLK